MGRAIRTLGNTVGNVAGAAAEAAGAVAETTGPVVNAGIAAAASSVAQGIGTLPSVGIAAAQSAFETAEATARKGLEQGLKSGIGGMGVLPPPGMLISQMAKAGGPMGEILKELQNPSLNVQKLVTDVAKGMQTGIEIGMNSANQDIQRFTEQMTRFNNAVADFRKKFDDLSAELIRQLKA